MAFFGFRTSLPFALFTSFMLVGGAQFFVLTWRTRSATSCAAIQSSFEHGQDTRIDDSALANLADDQVGLPEILIGGNCPGGGYDLYSGAL